MSVKLLLEITNSLKEKLSSEFLLQLVNTLLETAIPLGILKTIDLLLPLHKQLLIEEESPIIGCMHAINPLVGNPPSLENWKIRFQALDSVFVFYGISPMFQKTINYFAPELLIVLLQSPQGKLLSVSELQNGLKMARKLLFEVVSQQEDSQSSEENSSEENDEISSSDSETLEEFVEQIISQDPFENRIQNTLNRIDVYVDKEKLCNSPSLLTNQSTALSLIIKILKLEIKKREKKQKSGEESSVSQQNNKKRKEYDGKQQLPLKVRKKQKAQENI